MLTAPLQCVSEGGMMPFVIRSYRRFPVSCPVTYEHRFQEGEGIIWNFSPTGCRVSGNLPLECGNVCSLQITLPTNKHILLAGKVRWVRRDECGIETMVMDDESQEQLNNYIQEHVKAL